MLHMHIFTWPRFYSQGKVSKGVKKIKFSRAKQLFFGTPFKKTFFFWKCSFFSFNMANWALRSFFVPFKSNLFFVKKNRNLFFRDFFFLKKKKKFQIFPKLAICHLWWILSTFSLFHFFSKMHEKLFFKGWKMCFVPFFFKFLRFWVECFMFLRAPRCSQSSESMGSHCRPQACSGSPLIQRFRPVRWGASINTSSNHLLLLCSGFQ